MENEPKPKVTIDELARMMAEGFAETRDSFAEVRDEMKTGFAAVNKRVDLLDQKVDRVDGNLDQHRQETKDGFAGVHRLIGGISAYHPRHQTASKRFGGSEPPLR